MLVGVELLDDSVELPSFRHPHKAAYVFGPERGALSPGMLERARRRVAELGVANVELVAADMARYDLPPGTAAVVSSYAMEMLADYDDVIARLVGQLRPGGRVVLNGLRDPQRWPEWVVRLGSALSRPFGVSEAYRSHRPWEAIEAHTIDVVYDEAMAGAVYLAAGSARGDEDAEGPDE